MRDACEDLEMIALFGDGINTRFTKPMRDCRVFATAINAMHKHGDFLGLVSKVDGNQIHVKKNGETDLYLWKFPNGDKNETIEFGV